MSPQESRGFEIDFTVPIAQEVEPPSDDAIEPEPVREADSEAIPATSERSEERVRAGTGPFVIEAIVPPRPKTTEPRRASTLSDAETAEQPATQEGQDGTEKVDLQAVLKTVQDQTAIIAALLAKETLPVKRDDGDVEPPDRRSGGRREVKVKDIDISRRFYKVACALAFVVPTVMGVQAYEQLSGESWTTIPHTAVEATRTVTSFVSHFI